jgi:protease IV
MKFLSNVLATIIGLFIFCLLAFFGIILVAAIAGSSSDVPKTEKNSVLELDLSGITMDYTGKFSDPLLTLIMNENSTGLSEVLDAIEAAKEDDKIQGVTLVNNFSMLGLAQSKALRDQLEDFKEAGKFVVSYGNYYTQQDYYINSVADTIFLNPVGELDFKGLATEVMFFKDFQEKSGLKMEVIRHGKYKSAVEPFLANEMSPENREQISALLNSAWSTIVNDISRSRNITVEDLDKIAHTLGARTPEMALEQKMIDKIAYEDEFHNGIKHALKVATDKDYKKISVSDYAKVVGQTPKKGAGKDRIAVIYAQGEILGGEGNVSIIGEISMRRSLEEARKNKNIKAVVLRVDSPGGSALTSELIWREIELTKKTKPVVVSMGNLAASGGYYIACNANKIFAEPTTITGSIGVFGTLPNMTGLSKKMGLNTSQVKTHNQALGYSVFQPLEEPFREVVTESIEQVYSTFVNRVAQGRKMTFEQVDAVAQGRVWTGSEALELGLVDALGGLKDAIAEAAKLADIEKYRTRSFPEYDISFFDQFMGGLFSSQSRESLIKEEIGEEAYQTLLQLRRLQERRGIQAIMPFELKIH